MRGIKTITLSLIWAAVSFAQQPDYFPLSVGNQWIYHNTSRIPTSPLVIEVTGTETIGETLYYAVKGFPEHPKLLLRTNGQGTLVFYDEDTREEKTWVAFAAPVGEAFRTAIDPCNEVAAIRSRTAEFKLPLGEFRNGLEVAYEPANCADAGLTRETFLPYVGLAERRSSNFAGEQVYALSYARIGGTLINAPELGFGVSLNKSVYKAGDEIKIRITLRGPRENPLKLTFPSSQDFDIRLVNERGENVYTWSATRLFLQMVREVVVPDELNWAESIPADFPPGVYSLTANLVPESGRFEATVTFRIEP